MPVAGGPDMITDGLVLCLDAFDKNSYPGTGTTWRDVSGNNNTSTLTNGPTFDSGNGGSIFFDGSNDYVLTPVNIDANPSSVGAWFNASIVSGDRGIVLTDDGGWDKGFEINNGAFAIHVGTALAGTGVSASADTWYYGFLTYTNSSISFYVNGVNVWNYGAGPGASTGSTVEIGRAYFNGGAGSRFFQGKIAQVSIYNRALTASEILQNYNATKSRFLL